MEPRRERRFPEGDMDMLVKALCTIHDSTGWHNAGETFETKEDLGSAVMVIGESKAKKPESEPEKPEEEPKTRTTRRKKVEE